MMLNYSSFVNNESEIEDLNNHDKSTETIDIISCILNAPLMLISIIGNSLVLAAILRTPSLRSPTTIFLCSLAVSYLFVGLVVQPVYIATSFKHESHGYLVLAYNMLTLSICGVSLFTITAISVDRFLALHCHMRYQNLVTEKRAFYVSATFWFISIVLSFTSFLNVRNYYLTITVGISICLLTCSFSYIKIYDAYKSTNPDFPYWNYERFDLDEKRNDECKAEFRFDRKDIYKLAEQLQLPDEITTYNGLVVASVPALCMNEQEFILLYNAYKSTNPDFPYWNYERFDLDEKTNDECKAEFRFDRKDIYKLAEQLQLPDEITTYNGLVVASVHACILNALLILADMEIWFVILQDRFLSFPS